MQVRKGIHWKIRRGVFQLFYRFILPNIDQRRFILRNQLREIHFENFFQSLEKFACKGIDSFALSVPLTGFFFMYSSDQIRWAALMIKLLFGCTPEVGLSSR